MAVDKQLARIEAKLDALLKDRDIDATEIGPTSKQQVTTAPRKLSEAEQQAIDNAPATPTGATGAETNAPRTTALNAPATPAATETSKGSEKKSK